MAGTGEGGGWQGRGRGHHPPSIQSQTPLGFAWSRWPLSLVTGHPSVTLHSASVCNDPPRLGVCLMSPCPGYQCECVESVILTVSCSCLGSPHSTLLHSTFRDGPRPPRPPRQPSSLCFSPAASSVQAGAAHSGPGRRSADRLALTALVGAGSSLGPSHHSGQEGPQSPVPVSQTPPAPDTRENGGRTRRWTLAPGQYKSLISNGKTRKLVIKISSIQFEGYGYTGIIVQSIKSIKFRSLTAGSIGQFTDIDKQDEVF